MRTTHIWRAGVGAALLVILASTESALAKVDCAPTPAHHHAKHRPHHRRTKPHPAPKRVVKRTAKPECRHPVAVTLADIAALGSPEDSDILAPIPGFVPEPGPDSPGTEAARPGLTVAAALPSSDIFDVGSPRSGNPGGGPGGGPPGTEPPGGGPGGYPPPTAEPPPGDGGPPGEGPPPGVPEPATWTLMFIGLGAVGALARGRRATAFRSA